MAKTPDEIKKIFERCRQDVLALIEQLERERDATIEQLKEFDCVTCKHCNLEHIASICCKCKDASNWEWRGVKEEKDESTRED